MNISCMSEHTSSTLRVKVKVGAEFLDRGRGFGGGGGWGVVLVDCGRFGTSGCGGSGQTSMSLGWAFVRVVTTQPAFLDLNESTFFSCRC